MTEFDSKPIALVIPSLAGGGAERMWLNLAEALRDRGYPVDLVVLALRGEFSSAVPSGVSVFGSSRWYGRSRHLQFLRERQGFHDLRVGGIGPLVARPQYRRGWPVAARQLCSLKLVRDAEIVRMYIEARNPRALLAALPRASCATIMAHERSCSNAVVIVSVHNNVVKGYPADDNERARLLFPKADMVVGVSRGTAEDAARHLNLPTDRVQHIYNGVPVHQIDELCNAKSRLPEGGFPFEEPVVLSAVRLIRGARAAKDHDTLVRAFALVRRSLPAKLVFVGPGQHKESLRNEFLALAAELGVEDDIVFWGFDDNPYPYMRAAAVLVLSSRWEGFSNVIVEAMACGTPVVSTDTPFGPSEILDSGRFGPLVPIGDEHRMAEAIKEVLAGNHLPSDTLRARAEEFSVSRMADEYEGVIARISR